MNNLQELINLVNTLTKQKGEIYQVWVCCVKEGITTYDFSHFGKVPEGRIIVYTSKL